MTFKINPAQGSTLLILFISFSIFLVYRLSTVVRTTPSTTGQVMEGFKEWAQSGKNLEKAITGVAPNSRYPKQWCDVLN